MDIDALLPLQRCLLGFISNIVKYKDFVNRSALTEFQCDLVLGVCNVVVLKLNDFIDVVKKRKEILEDEKKVAKKN